MKSPAAIATMSALAFWIAFELLLFLFRAIAPELPRLYIGITMGSAISLVACGLSWLFIQKEGRSFADYGLVVEAGTMWRFFKGLVLGMLVFGSFLLVYWLAAPIAFEQIANASVLNAILFGCLTFTLLSLMEEIAFRGYFLLRLKEGLGTRGAIYVTSIAFGLYHGWTVDAFVGPAIWGLTYAVLALWSRGLAIPVGFHAGVNYVQSLISQKERYADGWWTVEVLNESAVETISAISLGLQAVLLVTGIVLVEAWIRREKRQEVAA